MKVYDKILKFLDDNKTDYIAFEHEFVHTSKDAANLRDTKLEEGAKSLLLKTKSGKFIMCVVPGNLKVDLKKVCELVKEKNVTLASPEEVLKITNCAVGSVPPLGNLFGIEIYFDSTFLSKQIMVFSAGSHYYSIKMNPEQFIKIVNPKIASFSKE